MRKLGVLVVALLLVFTPTPAWAMDNPKISDADLSKVHFSPKHTEVAKKLYQTYLNLGYSKEIAGALTGTAGQESGYNGGANDSMYARTGDQKYNSCSYYQWTQGRAKEVLAFAGVSSCAQIPPEKAAQFIDKELSEGGSQNRPLLLPPGGYNHLPYVPAAQADVNKHGWGIKLSSTEKFNSVSEFKKSNQWALALLVHMSNIERCAPSQCRYDKRLLYSAWAIKTFGGMSSNSSSTEGMSKGEGTWSEKLDWDLEGMPPKIEMEAGSEISMPSSDELTSSERSRVIELRDNFRQESQTSVNGLLGGVIALIGWLLVLWGALLLIAMAVDFTVPVFKATKFVTFGQREFSSEVPRPSGTIGILGVSVLSLAIMSLGVLVIAGKITLWVNSILTYLM